MSAGIIEDIARTSGAWLAPLTVEQYEAMLETGILREGAPIELIDGLLVQKDRRDAASPGMTIGKLHALAVIQVTSSLTALLQGQAFHVRPQQPVTLTDADQPEPDIVVAVGQATDYRTEHPGPQQIVLVVEVADSSLNYDRTTKQRLYAAARIPVYWIVDLTTNQIDVYQQPSAELGRYDAIEHYGIDDSVPLTLDSLSLTLPVRDVL